MKRDGDGDQSVGRSTFMRTISRITSGQMQLKTCIDYCFGVLLFENVRTLEFIVKSNVSDVLKQSQLVEQLTAVSDFLKHGYSTHLDTDSDFVHETRRALVGRACNDSDGSSSTSQGRNRNAGPTSDRSSCMDCLKPFQVIENIRKHVPRTDSGILEVLQDAEEKFRLFLGH